MNTTHWNPQQYEKFKAQRAKPFQDLKALLQKRPMKSALDLGCGTGELTRTLFDELKPTQMLAIDASTEMLAKSKAFETKGLQFDKSDIATFKPIAPFDLIFSNAALQWLPDHEQLFPKILNWVAPNGQIAVQMPTNFDHVSHVLADTVAREMFPAIFTGEEKRSLLPLERYAEMLFQHGFEAQVARIEVYGHPMNSGRNVVEWTKGTLLTSYQAKLTEIQFAEYLKAYEHQLLQHIGDGPYFYAFKRMLLWGTRHK